MDIWTARISYKGTDRLDITVKNTQVGTLGWLFAPTWTLVGGVKLFAAIANNDDKEVARWKRYQPLSSDQYTEQYYDMIRVRYKDHQPLFMSVFEEDRTLCCFCANANFCHRYLAADILSKVAAKHNIECHLRGEH